MISTCEGGGEVAQREHVHVSMVSDQEIHGLHQLAPTSATDWFKKVVSCVMMSM